LTPAGHLRGCLTTEGEDTYLAENAQRIRTAMRRVVMDRVAEWRKGGDMPVDELITRAIERTVLASRCLDGASDDLRTYTRNGGALGVAAADVLADQALRVEQIAQAIEELRD
jgi:hypothetical protein